MDMIADLKWKDGQCKDNMVLSSYEDAESELERYKSYGGVSVVDLTVPGIGRDVKTLRRISEQTGINVICATGWYLDHTHPRVVTQKNALALAETMVKELTEGIDGTGICAGVIGEIGCSAHLTPNEEKVLAAAAKAQSQTNAPLTQHSADFDTEYRRHAKETRKELEILRRNDADLSKVYVSHMDFKWNDVGYQVRIIEDYGVTLSYDGFGQEQYFNNLFLGAGGTTDRERLAALTELLRSGFEKHLMISSDVCQKIHLKKYGGWGYSHILEHMVPLLRENGVTDRQIETMMVDNPRHLFSK